MTISVFPAQPGTFLIERDPGTNPPRVTRVPVIGWQHIQGTMAFPIAVMNHGGMSHGKAILHPEGHVTDPTHRLTFENEPEWLNFIKSAKPKDGPKQPEPYQEGLRFEGGKPVMGSGTVREAPDTRADALTEEDAPEAPNASPAKPQATGQGISFGTKTFKTKSYWSMPAENAIFQIEGDTPYPKDGRCQKVTRDEYVALKKGGSAAIDPHQAAPEPEDDDAMDLV